VLDRLVVRELFELGVYFLVGRRVLDFIEAQITPHDNSRPRSRPTRANPRTIFEIAKCADLAEWRVRICLLRLFRRKLVQQRGARHWHVVLFR